MAMKSKKIPKLVVILGPTASGKTALGIRLARLFGGEIFSADSRQVYRGMDIGTAKVQDTQGVPHHLIDVVDPDQPFTVADWKRLALAAADDIVRRGKLPMVVGGTGLYIQSIVDNMDIPVVPPNPTLRSSLETKTDLELLRLIKKFDPAFASTPDARNRRRVIRALEVAILTGEGFTTQRRKGAPLFDVLEIGLTVPRRDLYAAIDARVVQQIDEGLIDEVRRLLKKYPATLPSMSAIGYREIVAHLKGDLTLQQAVERIQFATHAYVRRQMTWFRRDRRIKWTTASDQAELLIVDFLKIKFPKRSFGNSSS